MGKKRKQGESLEDVLARPWCYYCERDFDNTKVLVDHQKVKHFQCHFGNCHRRLNTVGGLRVHMAQVHKADLHEVPNANENRKDINVEVFAMIGMPESLIAARNEIVTRAYHNMEAEHMRRTGNPLAGSAAAKERNEGGSSKKVKIEGKEELKRRVAEAKAKREAIKKAQALGLPPPTSSTPPSATSTTPQNVPDSQAQPTPTPPAVQGYAAPPAGPPHAPTGLPPGFPPGFAPSFPPSFNGMPPGYGAGSMPPTNGLPPGYPPSSSPLPLGMPLGHSPSSSSFPPGMPPGFNTASTALPRPPPDSSNYHVPSPQIPKPSIFAHMPLRHSTESETPEPRFRYPSTGLHDTPEPVEIKSFEAPAMSSEQVTAKINAMWSELEAQKAAGVAYPQIPSPQPVDPPSSDNAGQPANEPTPNTAQQQTTDRAEAKAKAKTKLALRVAAGKCAQHSVLKLRDNLVSPEEKRARAGRYQPQPKFTPR
ncbi:hypothetical protein M409DRAFT_53265 [Zasmidium cellare ATCC 36951]|uniref:C2H2-type domain-containing protein n=1 Tax=Zasmidium cellare ATCC 36951 TaxID=1080233 RepID=A0A6A6CS78_ZASCE|nr:uncharacterized protein M409DRAFT_53265 [Zasmidium cellare ATCC 36951]KAF2168619.1 hypothetical protein M409DRAFT_53265 [Zasmidium cellare ATCC 36951]